MIALATQQKQKKLLKGDRLSKDPPSLCHLPSHSLSMHSNAKCRTQNPSLQPTRPSQNPRPMGHAPSNAPTSRGLAAISTLSDTEKARLFDHLQNAHANIAQSQSVTPSTTQQEDATSSNDQTVYFANAYSALATSPVRCDDMVSDTGAERFIFHSLKEFINLHPIKAVLIKTADGSCHMTAIYAGDVIVKSFDDDQIQHQMILPDTLFCPAILINLISAPRLCDAGATFHGNSNRMTYSNR